MLLLYQNKQKGRHCVRCIAVCACLFYCPEQGVLNFTIFCRYSSGSRHFSGAHAPRHNSRILNTYPKVNFRTLCKMKCAFYTAIRLPNRAYRVWQHNPLFRNMLPFPLPQAKGTFCILPLFNHKLYNRTRWNVGNEAVAELSERCKFN